MGGVLWIYLGFTVGEIYSDLVKDVVVVELAEASNGGLNGGFIRGNLGVVLGQLCLLLLQSLVLRFQRSVLFFQLLFVLLHSYLCFVQAGFNLHSVLQIITFEGDGSGYQLFLIVVCSFGFNLEPWDKRRHGHLLPPRLEHSLHLSYLSAIRQQNVNVRRIFSL